MLVILVIFAGTLLVLLVSSFVGLDMLPHALLSNALFALLALYGTHLLAARRLHAGLAGPPTWKGVGLGLLAIPLCYGVAWIYVEGIRRLGGVDPGLPIEPPPLGQEILVWAVMPAIFEEWLDRGVLWKACRRVMSENNTLVLTSALFAISHGLGGGGPLEYPHRFVMGLILGFLRARTGSLVPGAIAHFGNNLLATLSEH